MKKEMIFPICVAALGLAVGTTAIVLKGDKKTDETIADYRKRARPYNIIADISMVVMVIGLVGVFQERGK